MSMTGLVPKTIAYGISVGLISLIVLTIGHELSIFPTTNAQAHVFTVVLVLLVFFFVEFRKLYEIFSKEIPYQCRKCGRKNVRSETTPATVEGITCESCHADSFYLKQMYPPWVKSLGIFHAVLTIALIAGFTYISFIGSFSAFPSGVFQLFLFCLLVWPFSLLILTRRVENPVRPKLIVCASCGAKNNLSR